MLRRWLLLGLCLLILLNCGESVPVDCTPDEEQCTTETEGGFETGTVAGVAAGGAAVIALVSGANLGGEEDSGGGSSGSSSSGSSNTGSGSSSTPTAKVGVLLDSVVEGVSYTTTSGATGTTNQSGEFSYKDGDKVTFTLGGVELGQVDGAAVLTPVELAGANDTADRRVINLSRFLQSLDADGDPENGLSISSSARTALEGRSLNFNLPVSTFTITASVAVQSASGRSLVSASSAINHLHGTLGNRGLVDKVAETEEIRGVAPDFVPDSTLADAISANPELCQFNDTLLSSGQSIIAFQSESVAFGQSCSSQTRTCNNGTLTGSYSASSCTIRPASDCSLNGRTVAHGADVTAYSSSSVSYGETCSSQVRTCNDGTLTGSYSASSCKVAAPATCVFDGKTIEHGTSLTAFLVSNVAAGGSCSAELRSCENGALSGSYAYSSCEVAEEEEKSSCTFDGKLIDHGSTITAYSSSSVSYGFSCIAQLRTCNDGFLSGFYSASTCEVEEPESCAFNEGVVEHGSNITAYKTATVDYGNTCLSQERTCSRGFLTGSYAYSSCTVSPASSCTFNGQTVAHGTNVTAYEDDEVNFGVSCRVQERTCSNGILTGSYQYGTCTVAAAASCSFDEQNIPHGTNVTAYKDESVSFGSSCVSQQRTCSNGILTGSYTNPSCFVEGASSCTFNGETIESGNSVTAYQSSTVPYGSTCSNQSRTCTNGSLSGSYGFNSCSVSPAATCSFNGQTVAHDGVVTAYEESSVEYGSECQSEVKTCSNGTLSGSYTNSSCLVEAADTCTFNGQTIAHGDSVTAYLTESVAYGGSCSSQTRTCSDGTLSGNYEYETCTVQAAANCSFNGETVAHGSSVTAYLADYVEYDSVCSTEERLCINGNLSGNYQKLNCTVNDKVWSDVLLGTDENDYLNDMYLTANDEILISWRTDTENKLTKIDKNSEKIFNYTHSNLLPNKIYIEDGIIHSVGSKNDNGIYKFNLVKNLDSSIDSLFNYEYDFYVINSDIDYFNNNLYVLQRARGSVNSQPFYGAQDSVLRKFRSGQELWTKQFGTSDSETPISLKVDKDSIFVLGNYYEQLTNGGSDNDIFLKSFDHEGNEKWEIDFGSSTHFDYPKHVDTDANSEIYVAGEVHDPIFGEYVDSFSLTCGIGCRTFGNRTFIAKYDKNSNFKWAKIRNSPSNGCFSTAIRDMKIVDNNIYFIESIEETVNCKYGSNYFENYLVKLDLNGEELSRIFLENWNLERNEENNQETSSYRFEIDSNRDIIVVGITNLSTQGGYDVFVRKYDKDGVKY